MNDKWWFGPKFLKANENWPIQVWEADMDVVATAMKKSSILKEKEANEESSNTVKMTVPSNESNYLDASTVIEESRYNSFLKLCKVTVYVLRAINILKKKSAIAEELKRLSLEEIRNDDTLWTCTIPTVEELKNAEYLWLRHAQRQFYENG